LATGDNAILSYLPGAGGSTYCELRLCSLFATPVLGKGRGRRGSAMVPFERYDTIR